MRRIRKFFKVGILATAVISFSVAIFLAKPAQPSGATEADFQRLVAMGIVDGVATAHELGLDYLEHQPVELAASSGLMDSIQRVNSELVQMPEDISIAYPLGTNRPVRIGDIPNDDGSLAEVDDAACVGFVDNAGQPKAFTPADGSAMTDNEYRNGGNIVMTPEAQYMLVADASGGFLQARRVPVFNIIVQQRGQRFLVPNVNANAVCRDLLNAVLNRTVRRI